MLCYLQIAHSPAVYGPKEWNTLQIHIKDAHTFHYSRNCFFNKCIVIIENIEQVRSLAVLRGHIGLMWLPVSRTR